MFNELFNSDVIERAGIKKKKKVPDGQFSHRRCTGGRADAMPSGIGFFFFFAKNAAVATDRKEILKKKIKNMKNILVNFPNETIDGFYVRIEITI